MAKFQSRKEEENRKKTEILHESRLDQLLFSNGFVRKKVNSDGNCFFEAFVLAMGQNVDGQHLRQLLCQHLEENVEEYIGFLKNRSSKEDDLIFLKEYFKEIDVLKQNGYWSSRAGDFLPLALANWSHRQVCIYSSRPEQPVTEIQPTLGSVVEDERICLAYTSSPGVSEHYDGCIKCPMTDLDQLLLDEGQKQDHMTDCQTQIQNEDQGNESTNLSQLVRSLHLMERKLRMRKR